MNDTIFQGLFLRYKVACLGYLHLIKPFLITLTLNAISIFQMLTTMYPKCLAQSNSIRCQSLQIQEIKKHQVTRDISQSRPKKVRIQRL